MLNYFTWILCCLMVSIGMLGASTVIISYQGGNAPNQSPVPGSTVGSNTNVVGSSYLDGTRAVWRIEDPGYISGTNGKTSGLYYEKTFAAAQRDLLYTQGWHLDSTIKLPTSDPTSNKSWGADSNAWLGYAYNFPVASGETPSRAVFAFMFVRATNGTTNVQVYGAGTPGLRNVSGD